MGLTSWFDKKTAPRDVEHVVEVLCGIKDVITDIQKVFTKNYDSYLKLEYESELASACFELGWPLTLGSQKDVDLIERLFTIYTKYVCEYPTCIDRRRQLIFKDEFKRFEKYILPFSKKLKEEAYRILDSKYKLERYRLEDGRLVYKLEFICNTCKKSCTGTLVEIQKGEIPTTTHAFVSLVQHLENTKMECCVCRKDKTKCDFCQQRWKQ